MKILDNKPTRSTASTAINRSTMKWTQLWYRERQQSTQLRSLRSLAKHSYQGSYRHNGAYAPEDTTLTLLLPKSHLLHHWLGTPRPPFQSLSYSSPSARPSVHHASSQLRCSFHCILSRRSRVVHSAVLQWRRGVAWDGKRSEGGECRLSPPPTYTTTTTKLEFRIDDRRHRRWTRGCGVR